MSNKPTQSSKYPSRYSPGKWISSSQYITELICEKKAQKNKKDLPNEFWNLPEWKKFYKQQILAACGLLKIYDDKAIIRALQNKAAWSIYSLRAPHLDDIIKEEQRLLELEQEKVKPINLDLKSTDSKPRIEKSRKNIITKLKELDG